MGLCDGLRASEGRDWKTKSPKKSLKKKSSRKQTEKKSSKKFPAGGVGLCDGLRASGGSGLERDLSLSSGEHPPTFPIFNFLKKESNIWVINL